MGAYASIRGLVAACLVTGMLPGLTSAASPVVLVDSTPTAGLVAASARGEDLVVVWRQRVDGSTVPVATVSANGGATWRPPRGIIGGTDAGGVDADACEGVALVTFAADAPTPGHPDRATAVLGVHATDVDAGWNDFGIAAGLVRDPRVACRGLQPMVAWAARSQGTWRLKAALWGDAADYLPGGTTPAVRQTFTVGEMTGPGRQRPAIDASGDRAFVAWVSGNRVCLARWKTDGVAPHDLVRGPDARLGRGTAAAPVHDPQVAVDGDTVVVAWTRCGDLLARVSSDAGATFSPVVTLFDGRCGAKPSVRLDGLAAEDGRMAISVRIRRTAGDQARILTSDDGFATRAWLTLDQAGDRWIAGWVGAPSPDLGAASDLGGSIAWNPPGTLEP